MFKTCSGVQPISYSLSQWLLSTMHPCDLPAGYVTLGSPAASTNRHSSSAFRKSPKNCFLDSKMKACFLLWLPNVSFSLLIANIVKCPILFPTGISGNSKKTTMCLYVTSLLTSKAQKTHVTLNCLAKLTSQKKNAVTWFCLSLDLMLDHKKRK